MADGFDEAGELKSFQKRVGDLLRPLSALTRLRARDAALAGQLDTRLRALPESSRIAAAMDEIRQRGTTLLRSVRQAREAELRRTETELLNGLRAAGRTPREVDGGWRIGSLEWQFDKSQARVRACFNREIVVAWTAIASRDEFDKLMASAEASLKSADLGGAIRRQLFWAAYQEARKGSKTALVLLKELYKQVRLQLVKLELESGKVDKRLESADFPRWRFLYNLDLYRSEAGSLPAEIRLGFETGSQADHARGLAMVLNGLEPSEPYKTFCYVFSVTGGSR